MKSIHYRLLAQRLLWLLAAYSLLRIFFLGINYNEFRQANFGQMAEALLSGVRFDIATITWINSIFVLLSILPFRWLESLVYQRVIKILFLVSNLPFLLLNAIDIFFFKFTARRTSAEILRIGGDVLHQTPQLLRNYWFVPLGVGLLAWALWRLYPNYQHEKSSKTLAIWKSWLAILPVAALCVLAIRSSLAIKPLQEGHAFNITPTELGNVVLNTPFVFLKTLDNETVERLHYFPNNQAITKLIHKPLSENPNPTPTRQNVVVIILESFGSEYLGTGNPYKGYMPFLDSLAREGLFFKNTYANGRRSIEAMSAIMAGVPSLMKDAYISSGFQSNHLYGLGTALRENGYQTAFFHGGTNGTMNFDMFAKLAGFQQYFGQNEYPNKADYDGNWGIFDEPFLQFTAQKMSGMKQPFGVGIFTLSSHQPYTIPAQHKGRFPKGTLAVHESLGYADYSLKAFFKAAAQTDWYNNTVFVLTADHTQESQEIAYQTELGNYDVPMIWFSPQKRYPAQPDTARAVQHADIMPSVLDYLGLKPRERHYFGSSIFGEIQPEIVNLSDGHYLYINPPYYLHLYADGRVSLFDYRTQKPIHQPYTAEQIRVCQTYESRLKAYLQYYNNGLLDNNWYHFTNSSALLNK